MEVGDRIQERADLHRPLPALVVPIRLEFARPVLVVSSTPTVVAPFVAGVAFAVAVSSRLTLPRRRGLTGTSGGSVSGRRDRLVEQAIA